MADDFDFKTDMDALGMLVRLAAMTTVDLERLENTVARAEAVGPLLHPSAFVEGRAFENLEGQRELLGLVAPFIRGSKKLIARVEKERVDRAARTQERLDLALAARAAERG